jgi:hypothetical protein
MPENSASGRQRQFRPMTPQQLQVHEDMQWARTNNALEQRYRGRVIAVCRKQVIADAASLEDLLHQIRQAGRPLEELAIVEYPDPFTDVPR